MDLDPKERALLSRTEIGRQVRLRGKLWVKRENGILEPVKSTPSSVPKNKKQEALSSSTIYSPARERPSEQQHYKLTSGSQTDRLTGASPSHLQHSDRPFQDEFQQSASEGRPTHPGEDQTGLRENDGQSGNRHDTSSDIAESTNQLSLENTQLTAIGSDLPPLPNATQGGEYFGSASHQSYFQILARETMTVLPAENDPWKGLALARHASNTGTSISTTRALSTEIVSRGRQRTASIASQSKPTSRQDELEPERQDATSKNKGQQREEYQLSGRCQELAEIPRKFLLRQADFIKEFPEAMTAKGAEFYAEAQKFARANDTARIENYLHYTLLLYHYKDQPKKAINFLQNSAQNGRFKPMQQFRSEYDKLRKKLMKDFLSERSGETKEADPDITKIGLEIPPVPTSPTISSTGNDTLVKSLDSKQITIQQGVYPENVENELPELHGSYVEQNGRQYFQRGVVFKICWPEIFSSEERKTESSAYRKERRHTSNIKDGMYKGQKTIYKIRRMIVARNRDGFCFCVSIVSYEGRGCAKPGLTKREVQAHAIAYDATKKPRPTENEPTLGKEPVAFDLIAGESLTPASRIHFSKPFPVNWNSPVAHVGVVAQSHRAILEKHLRQELTP